MATTILPSGCWVLSESADCVARDATTRTARQQSWQRRCRSRLNGSDDHCNVLFGMMRAVVGSRGAVKPAFGTYASGTIKMYPDPSKQSNVANPQSPPDSAIHRDPDLPSGLKRTVIGPPRILVMFAYFYKCSKVSSASRGGLGPVSRSAAPRPSEATSEPLAITHMLQRVMTGTIPTKN